MHKTILKGYDNEIIATYPSFMDFPYLTLIEIESAPNGKPLLTKYSIERKSIKISLNGNIEVTYVVNKLSASIEQEYFM